MTSDETTYKPFVPPAPMFEDDKKDASPKITEAGSLAANGKPKRNRKSAKKCAPAAAKPKIPKAPKFERPTRSKKKKRAATKTAHDKKLKRNINKAFKNTRNQITDTLYGDKKKRKPRALKMSLADAMAISALLKAKDFIVFDSLTETLQSVNKTTRKRVLAAISKVFG